MAILTKTFSLQRACQIFGKQVPFLSYEQYHVTVLNKAKNITHNSVFKYFMSQGDEIEIKVFKNKKNVFSYMSYKKCILMEILTTNILSLGICVFPR